MALSRLTRKSQLNQAFTYISILIIVAVLAVFGTKAISGIFSANCESKNTEFSLKLEKYVEDYSERGSVVTQNIAAPCDTKQICFVNSSLLGDVTFGSTGNDIDDNVIISSVRQGTFNTFVLGEFTTPVMKLDKIATNERTLCVIPKNSYVKLRFSGLGRTTLVESAD
jgi:hypothetical protein